MRIGSLATVAGLALLAGGSFAQEAPKMALEAFDLTDVRLADGPFKTALEANRAYLHALDFDRLMWTFRQNAGLPTPGEPLGGWEAPAVEVRGHFIGHTLSACALTFAATGDEGLRDRAVAMVAEMRKCQEALGGEYLSAFPESFWDRLESAEQIPWAPYYVIHKIMAGLLDVYQFCGDDQALEVLKGMASYFGKRLDKLSIWEVDRMLNVEFGGMSEVLHSLYAVTRVPAHLALAQKFDKAAFLGPLALEHDNLSRLHANTHIPEIVAAARRYEVTGDERYRKAVEFFWQRVAQERSYATGGSNQAEHWGDPGRLAGTLGTDNQESCTTYNMLKVTRNLLLWTSDPAYGDYYERSVMNGILGTQDPETGMLIYFLPMTAGNRKIFGTPNDSFWCCYGTGIESFAKLGDSIYFHDQSSLTVNLFIASEVRWAEKGVTLTQATDFPQKAETRLAVRADKPVRFALRVRVPGWTTGAEALVNGEAMQAEAGPGSFLVVDREWRDGDTLTVSFPMGLWASPMPDDPELVAVMYGPLVLAGLTDRFRCFLADAAQPQDWIKPVAGETLRFRTVGQEPEMDLKPLYQVLHEPYGIYWTVTGEGSPTHRRILAEEEARRKREARVVDRVLLHNPQSETAHNLQGALMASGPHLGRAWRHATSGGWWSWDLLVVPGDAALTLSCAYWGSDVPPRTFDILVDGQVIATQALNRDKPGEFFDVEYSIPPELTRGKQSVTVMFQPHEGCTAGGVFECVILKPEAADAP